MYVILILVMYALLSIGYQYEDNRDLRPISDLVAAVRENRVQDVTVTGTKVDVLLVDGTSFATRKEQNSTFDDLLRNNNLSLGMINGEVVVEEPLPFQAVLTTILSVALPVIILLFIFKQLRGAGADVMSFGQSKAKLFHKGASKITFKDVAGINESKKELE